jgi:hypothetical protein
MALALAPLLLLELLALQRRLASRLPHFQQTSDTLQHPGMELWTRAAAGWHLGCCLRFPWSR